MDSLILYSYGLCNLNCIYCNIDKNKYLKNIDNLLEASFINYKEQYMSRIHKWFSDKLSLETIETWGGEPLYRIERIFPLLRDIIGEYPNFHRYYSSTNFSYPEWPDKVISVLKVFGEFPLREFEVDLQLSCDGPEEINDANRGKGTTARCIANFDRLINLLKDNCPTNIKVNLFNKQTLSLDNINNKMQTKEDIINYYKFFEDNFIDKVQKLNLPNVKMSYGVPNLAEPSLATKADGIALANTCKLCREIEKDYNNPLRYYKTITLFDRGIKSNIRDIGNVHCGGCGVGTRHLHVLPDNNYCTCHVAYMDLVDAYKSYALKNRDSKIIDLGDFLSEHTVPSILNEEQYSRFRNNMYKSTETSDKSRSYNIFETVKALADAELIDKKYTSTENIFKVLGPFADVTCYCINSNRLVTHSMTTITSNNAILFLNGALEYIVEDYDI